jgi:hypothetical protein
MYQSRRDNIHNKVCPWVVVLCSHKNCTEEVAVIYNRTEVFVDLISYVIKSACCPVHSKDISPPVYKPG